MRVMWGDLGWLGDCLILPNKQRAAHSSTQVRVSIWGMHLFAYRRRRFEIGAQGRGVLLSESLNPEVDFLGGATRVVQ
jgi:hypothetical protein